MTLRSFLVLLLFCSPCVLTADENNHHEDLTEAQLGKVHFPSSCAPAMHAMTSDKMSKRFMKCGTVAGIAPVARMRLETLETSGGPGAAVTMFLRPDG